MMKFLKESLITKKFPAGEGDITIQEYKDFTVKTDYSIDGAIAIFNGSSGEKINKGFDELVFVISGELKIKEGTEEYTLKKDETAIIKKGVSHSIEGFNDTKVYIVCNPPFNNVTSYEDIGKD